MLFAGSDTSSTTVEWAMASLLENPEVMEKVKRELTRVVGARAQVQESDIAQLPSPRSLVGAGACLNWLVLVFLRGKHCWLVE